MLIKVQKIKKAAAKDKDGKKVPNPFGAGDLTEDTVVEEAIDVNSIKAIRPFRSDGKTHRDINGDKCVIYLHSKPTGDDGSEKRRTPEIHVVADYGTLIEEVNELKSRQKN